MRKDVRPEYVETWVTCTCGNGFTARSTLTSGEIRVDVCSACHPFYIGKQKVLDTAGHIDRFEARCTRYNTTKEVAAEKKAVEAKEATSEATVTE